MCIKFATSWRQSRSTSLDESEQFADNEVELRRVGGVNALVVSRDLVSNFLRQSHIGCRIVNWVTTADGRVQLSRVGVGVCIGYYIRYGHMSLLNRVEI